MISSNQTKVSTESLSATSPNIDHSRALRTLNWSSMGFALLQNICAAVLAVNSIRIAIGVGSLAAAGGLWPAVSWFHSDQIRIPMMVLALVGSVVNLLALWQIRRLRRRPASQWRQAPLTDEQVRSERFQLLLSVGTLLLLAFEFCLHLYLHRNG